MTDTPDAAALANDFRAAMLAGVAGDFRRIPEDLCHRILAALRAKPAGEVVGGSAHHDPDCPGCTGALDMNNANLAQYRPRPAAAEDDGLRSIDTAPKDGAYFLIVGNNFDGGAAVVQWDDALEWWTLDDGKNPEIMMRGESGLRGWLPLPQQVAATTDPTAPILHAPGCPVCDQFRAFDAAWKAVEDRIAAHNEGREDD